MKPIYKEAYPHLFQPLILGKKKVEIKNRVFTAPMGCPLAQHADGRLNEYGVYFYGRQDHPAGGAHQLPDPESGK